MAISVVNMQLLFAALIILWFNLYKLESLLLILLLNIYLIWFSLNWLWIICNILRISFILRNKIFSNNLKILKIILRWVKATDLGCHGVLFIQLIIYFEIRILSQRLLQIKIRFRPWLTIFIFILILFIRIIFFYLVFFILCFFFNVI